MIVVWKKDRFLAMFYGIANGEPIDNAVENGERTGYGTCY